MATQVIAPASALSLIPRSAIDILAQQIARQFDPERIYLFGSYAYGQPTPDSDVDVMVMMDTEDMRGQAGRIRSAVKFAYPLDLLVRTPAYFAERLELGDFFIEQIAQHGRVLYDSGRRILDYAIAHPPVNGPQFEQMGGATLNKLTAEWVTKAERDYRSAMREASAPDDPNFDLACYLAQQCAEKYLKAYLQEHGIHSGKTHELDILLVLCQTADPSFAQLQSFAVGLKDYAVDPRYPGFTGTADKAQAAYQDASAIRAFVRAKLGV